jgi:hypothetical protein
VSEHTRWTTLGGNKSGGSVTEAGKGLREASVFFWNLQGFRFTAESISTKTIDPPASNAGTYTATASLEDFDTDGTSFDSQPKDRVCVWNTVISDGVDDQDPDVSPIVSAHVSVVFLELDLDNPAIISRMYNGSVEDEGNFVGYGFGSQMTIRLSGSGASGGASVTLRSASSALSGTDYCTITSNVAGLDMELVCQASGDIENPANASASSDDGEKSADVSFTGFDFYTY